MRSSGDSGGCYVLSARQSRRRCSSARTVRHDRGRSREPDVAAAHATASTPTRFRLRRRGASFTTGWCTEFPLARIRSRSRPDFGRTQTCCRHSETPTAPRNRHCPPDYTDCRSTCCRSCTAGVAPPDRCTERPTASTLVPEWDGHCRRRRNWRSRTRTSRAQRRRDTGSRNVRRLIRNCDA